MSRARSALAATALAAVTAACGGSASVAPPAQVAAREVRAPGALSAAPPLAPVVQRGDGRLSVVPGSSAPAGEGDLTTYAVQVEGGIGVEPGAFAAEVEETLSDPRSWTARRSMQRVGKPEDADLRVVLASPDLTDEMCAPLVTDGYFSCAHGATAVLNVARWLRGAPSYRGHLQDYRAYVVNHEVGHTLGFGHARCPGRGRPAPVMLQQTKGLDGCLRSPWPYP